MTHQNAQDLIDELDTLLDRERQALVEGDLELLSRMLEQKQILIDNINTMDALEREQLDQVHDKISRCFKISIPDVSRDMINCRT